MLTVRYRATDGEGTFTLLDSQPCRLLPRLDTGGWLALARPRLSPGKKRQASLDALT